DGAERAGDLYFVTYYDYDLKASLADLGRAGVRVLGLLPAALLVLILPGLAIGVWGLPLGEDDPGVGLALVVGLSLVFWPLLLLWASVFDLSLRGAPAWILVGLLALLTAWGLRRRRIRPRALLGAMRQGGLPLLALGVVLLFAAASRALQVRELLAPPWIDSVHHTVVTRSIIEQGHVPYSLAPYVEVEGFFYHFGFHAVAAALGWLGGLRAEAAVLLLGQILNALAALMAYALTRVWTRRPWAGVGAALVAGALSYLPAYYLSWGRYTQLAGLCVLPVLCAVTWRLWCSERLDMRLLTMAALLVVGLLLTHYRVIAFYAAFALTYAALAGWQRRGVPGAWRRLGVNLAMMAALALLLAVPWLVRMALHLLPRIGPMFGGLTAREGVDTSFPQGLLQVGWTQPLLYLAGASLIWAALRDRAEIVCLAVWAAICFVPANLHLFGLANTFLMHNQAVVIAFWLPVSVAVGWLAADVTGLLAEGAARLGAALRLMPLGMGQAWGRRGRARLLLAATLALGAWGSWRMVDVVNPVTVLLSREDWHAIAWAREHTPPDARFLINTWRWQGDLRAGSDGGWWLPMLADRQVTLPCALYAQGEPAYVSAINALAGAVEDANSLDDPALLAHLQAEGVTHVFVGSKGGRLLPKELDPNPHFTLRYALGPTRIYAFTPQVSP
ncbi:MAG: hypothetical protein JXA74_14640, partial [Anaerolineae bacterium]|nr:hypothetical protein [Anaerolineae bacterium]